MADHIRREMDIETQENGFMKFTTWAVIAIIALLVFMAFFAI
jgi:hypothetical protein